MPLLTYGLMRNAEVFIIAFTKEALYFFFLSPPPTLCDDFTPFVRSYEESFAKKLFHWSYGRLMLTLFYIYYFSLPHSCLKKKRSAIWLIYKRFQIRKVFLYLITCLWLYVCIFVSLFEKRNFILRMRVYMYGRVLVLHLCEYFLMNL